jgi:hypothetical protein
MFPTYKFEQLINLFTVNLLMQFVHKKKKKVCEVVDVK